MKPKKIKASRYWRRPDSLQLYGTKKTAQYYSGFAADKVAPVYILPADAASVDAMVEQMAEAACKSTFGGYVGDAMRENFMREARAALAAIGIKATK